MSGPREKDARNQALFREVNERIEKVNESFGMDGQESFVCECGNPECTQAIALTRAEAGRRTRRRRITVTGVGVAPLDQAGPLDAQLRRLRCSICGYGASCRAEPDRCPMCGSQIWNDEPHRAAAADGDSPLRRVRPTAATELALVETYAGEASGVARESGRGPLADTRVTLAQRQAGSR